MCSIRVFVPSWGQIEKSPPTWPSNLQTTDLTASVLFAITFVPQRGTRWVSSARAHGDGIVKIAAQAGCEVTLVDPPKMP